MEEKSKIKEFPLVESKDFDSNFKNEIAVEHRGEQIKKLLSMWNMFKCLSIVCTFLKTI